MTGVFAFVFKLMVLAFGLVFAAVLLAATAAGTVVAGVLWLLHAAWARLTGRPIQPIRFHVYRGGRFVWKNVRPAAPPASQEPFVPRGSVRRVGGPDVSDVDPK